MANKVIRTERDLAGWVSFLEKQPMPMTVSHIRGAKRTNPQNKTINMWYAQAASIMGDCTNEDVRAECKLQFGVPILRRDDAAFLLKYDTDFKPFPYETKVKLFKALEPAVTSKMTVKQLTEYMERMRMHFAAGGINLIDPDARKYEAFA